MALYPLPDYIKRRRNDLITSEDQQRRDLSNLPAGFWLPTAALTNISKKLALSHLTCFGAVHVSPAGNRVMLNSCVFQMSRSAACRSPSAIPLHLDQPFHLLQYSFLLKLCQPDVNLLSNHKWTMQYKCLQLQCVDQAMQKTVQISLKWSHLSLLLCLNMVPS